MKFDYNQEFDINEIYRKLTAPSKPMMVKASEFFEQEGYDNLAKLKVVVERLLTYTEQA